jgi:hypothetical protein
MYSVSALILTLFLVCGSFLAIAALLNRQGHRLAYYILVTAIGLAVLYEYRLGFVAFWEHATQ